MKRLVGQTIDVLDSGEYELVKCAVNRIGGNVTIVEATDCCINEICDDATVFCAYMCGIGSISWNAAVHLLRGCDVRSIRLSAELQEIIDSTIETVSGAALIHSIKHSSIDSLTEHAMIESMVDCNIGSCASTVLIRSTQNESTTTTGLQRNEHMKYRVVTFQSAEVIRILLKNKLYVADASKSRTQYFSDEDYRLCKGNAPIYVFQHPCFKTTKIGHEQWCELLQTFKCESGLGELDGMYMIELLLDTQPPKGTTHNDCSLACVIPEIKLDDVAAVYMVSPTEDRFFKNITPIYTYVDDILFKHAITFNSEDYESDTDGVVNLLHYKTAEEYYLSDTVRDKNDTTPTLWKNK